MVRKWEAGKGGRPHLTGLMCIILGLTCMFFGVFPGPMRGHMGSHGVTSGLTL